MFAKFASFFTNFFCNFTADPVSSAKGVALLTCAAGTCYGMATGKVPLNIGIPTASGFAVSGVHALGTNTTTGVECSTAAKIEQLIGQAAALTPPALTITDHYNAIKDQAGQAQAILSAAADAANALSALSPLTPGAPLINVLAPLPDHPAPSAAQAIPTTEQITAAQAVLDAANAAKEEAASQRA
jgi:hypothetical protein